MPRKSSQAKQAKSEFTLDSPPAPQDSNASNKPDTQSGDGIVVTKDEPNIKNVPVGSAPPPETVSPLLRQNLTRMGVKFQIWQAVVPSGKSLDYALRPEFWAHVANQVAQFDEIRLVSEDGSFVAWAVVAVKHPYYLKLVPYADRGVFLDRVAEEADSLHGITVAFKGLTMRWSVIRDLDGAVLSQGWPDKPTAMKERQQHLKVLGYSQ